MSLDDLNSKQRKAVEFSGKHVLVLAGAGTGKTKTIIARAAYLIKNGVNPSRIQILSFTRKSAGEIVNRVNTMFQGKEAKLLKGNTFHSWCMNLIKSNPKIFQFHDYIVIDPDDQVNIFKMICGNNKPILEKTGVKPNVFLHIYSFCINAGVNLTNAIRHLVYFGTDDESTNNQINEVKSLYETIIRAYIEYKKQHKYLDYDDLLNNVIQTLRRNEVARRHIARQYDHILVDEMQDTNPLQWNLLMLFQQECHLFCVGDDAQSIYGFRGADFRNVHQFKERLPHSETLMLEDNYRSTQEILDVSNWLLEQSPLEYNKKLRAIRGEGEKPILMNFNSDWEEANWIADDIVKNRIEKSKDYSDHLILSRTAYGLKHIEGALIAKKIPYKLFGGIQFMQSSHIRDIFSALRIVANIKDEIAWMRYLQLWEGIGDITAAKYVQKVLVAENIDDCIEILKGENIKTAELIQTLEAIKALNNNPAKAIEVALEIMNKQLSYSYKEEWEDKRKPDFKILIQIAKDKPTINDLITDFFLDPTLNESYLSGAEVKDIVTLSTVHSAKGLEADICYVINVSPNNYPLSRAIKNGKDAVEEERRCLYVALTRAKNKLIVTRNLYSVQTYDEETEEQGEETEEQKDTAAATYFFNKIPESLFENNVMESVEAKKRDSYKGESINYDPFAAFDFN